MARQTSPLSAMMRAGAAMCIASSIAACSPLVDLGASDGPPARIFDIDARSAAGIAATVTSPKVILIEEPTTTNILDRDRIAVRLGGGEIQYLSGVRFADRPARLIRRVIKDDIDAVEGYTGLGRGSLDVASDYRLKLIVRDFQVSRQASSGPQSVVSIQALLLNASGTLVASQTFESSETLSSTAPDAVIAGLRIGLLAASDKMRRWIVETLDQ